MQHTVHLVPGAHFSESCAYELADFDKHGQGLNSCRSKAMFYIATIGRLQLVVPRLHAQTLLNFDVTIFCKLHLVLQASVNALTIAGIADVSTILQHIGDQLSIVRLT